MVAKPEVFAFRKRHLDQDRSAEYSERSTHHIVQRSHLAVAFYQREQTAARSMQLIVCGCPRMRFHTQNEKTLGRGSGPRSNKSIGFGPPRLSLTQIWLIWCFYLKKKKTSMFWFCSVLFARPAEYNFSESNISGRCCTIPAAPKNVLFLRNK